MSIGRRLIDLARAELNSLLDRAAELDGDDYGEDRDGSGGPGASSLSDRELEEEIERRRQARAEAEAAARGERPPPPGWAGRTRPSSTPPRRTAAGDEAIRKAYAALEIPAGSDFETVRHAYRRLMRKYHPDLHTGRPDKQKAATDLTQRLTEAYKTLDKHLRR